MQGLSRSLGVGPTVFFNGKQCDVRGRDMGFHARVEAEILAKRGNPFDGLIYSARELKGADGKPDSDAINVLTAAFARWFRTYRFADADDVAMFLYTPYGEAFEVWYCLRHNFEDGFSVAEAQHVLQESRVQATRQGQLMEWAEWKASITKAIDIASGEDMLGNWTGLPPKVVATEAGQRDEQSDTSAKSTDTHSSQSAE